jgi:hypothetical protein
LNNSSLSPFWDFSLSVTFQVDANLEIGDTVNQTGFNSRSIANRSTTLIAFGSIFVEPDGNLFNNIVESKKGNARIVGQRFETSKTSLFFFVIDDFGRKNLYDPYRDPGISLTDPIEGANTTT